MVQNNRIKIGGRSVICKIFSMTRVKRIYYLSLVSRRTALTHLSRMDFPISIGRTSLFQILGVLGGIFHLYSNSNRTFCKQTVETAASGLGLYCLHMSHKKDVRLRWINIIFNYLLFTNRFIYLIM